MGTREAVRARVLQLIKEHKINLAELARIAGRKRNWATNVMRGKAGGGYDFTMPMADKILNYFGESVAGLTRPDSGASDNQTTHETVVADLNAKVSVLTRERDQTAKALKDVLAELKRILDRHADSPPATGTGTDRARPHRRR